MKKILSIALALCLGIGLADAQETAFPKGTSAFNLGVGLVSGLYGSGYKNKIPPVTLSYEYCLKDNLFKDKGAIGIGGLVGYTGAKWNYLGGDYGWKYSNIIIGVRGNLHYSFLKKLDTYVSLMLGYNVASAKSYGSWDDSLYKASAGGFRVGFNVGARYYFTNAFGVFAELGYDISYFKVGVSLKL